MAELKNIRIAISGIYDYAFEELGNLGLSFSNAPDFTEKKAIYKVYRPATVLASAVDKFKMLPLTHHHPRNPVDEKNFRELTIGFTDSNPFVDYLEDKNEVGIRATALLYDSEALDAYERGEIQLSPGYFADFEWQNGVSPNGEKYDIIMKEIKDVNHLALLPNGRGGNDAVVLDSRKTIFDIVREQMQKDCGFDESEHKRDEKGQFTENESKTPKGHAARLREKFNEKTNQYLGSSFENRITGINAVFSKESQKELRSRTQNTKENGFTLEEHFEVANQIKELFENATLEKTHNDTKHNKPNLEIERFLSKELSLKSGKRVQACITVKHTLKPDGRIIYSVEAMDIKNALEKTRAKGQRQNNTVGLSNNATLSQDSLSRKTIFEIVQMNIFDQIRYGAI